MRKGKTSVVDMRADVRVGMRVSLHIPYTHNGILQSLSRPGQPCRRALEPTATGQIYMGHNYVGDEHVGHNYVGQPCRRAREPMATGQNYIGHNYVGHNYVGHKYIGHEYMQLYRP